MKKKFLPGRTKLLILQIVMYHYLMSEKWNLAEQGFFIADSKMWTLDTPESENLPPSWQSLALNFLIMPISLYEV